MKRFFVLLFAFMNLHGFAQDSTSVVAKDSNPVIFMEGGAGYSGGKSQGWTISYGLNYQYKNELFTARYIGLADYRLPGANGGLIIFPVPRRVETIDEASAMYGKRYIYNNKSISFSVGIGMVKQRKLKIIDSDNHEWIENKNFGFPFEFNIKWFKREKKPFRIYWVVPVGPPISFGGSIGFKFAGNIGKTNYAGIGLTYSYGWHRNY
jgi:hypothetical protein